MKTLPSLCLLALLLFASRVTLAAAKADYMIVNLMWPGNACQQFLWTKTCCIHPTVDKPELDFLVQSVDIYDSSTGTIVCNCGSSCDFKINSLYGLMGDLYSYWPCLACPAQNGYDLWKAAWCVSGSCSGLAQGDYFNRTLQLRAKANLLRVLGSAGIVPSDSKVYKLDDIRDALLFKLGFSTVVECDIWTGALARIRLCASINGRSLVPCPISRESTYCRDTVKFWRFTYNMLGGGGAHSGREDAIELPSDGAAAH